MTNDDDDDDEDDETRVLQGRMEEDLKVFTTEDKGKGVFEHVKLKCLSLRRRVRA